LRSTSFAGQIVALAFFGAALLLFWSTFAGLQTANGFRGSNEKTSLRFSAIMTGASKGSSPERFRNSHACFEAACRLVQACNMHQHWKMQA